MASLGSLVPSPRDWRVVLPHEAHALLSCMRVWVAGQARPVKAERGIQHMRLRLSLSGALPLLEGFMLALGGGATRKLEVSTLVDQAGRLIVSEDGRTLLGLSHKAHSFGVVLPSRGFVIPGLACAALRNVTRIGLVLARAGHFLPVPGTRTQRFALAASSAEVLQRAEARVH